MLPYVKTAALMLLLLVLGCDAPTNTKITVSKFTTGPRGPLFDYGDAVITKYKRTVGIVIRISAYDDYSKYKYVIMFKELQVWIEEDDLTLYKKFDWNIPTGVAEVETDKDLQELKEPMPHASF